MSLSQPHFRCRRKHNCSDRRSRRANRRAALCKSPRFEGLEDRLNLTAAIDLTGTIIDLPITPLVQMSGNIASTNAQDIYRVQVPSEAVLSAQLRPSGFDTLLSLLDDQGHTLIQSEATSPTNRLCNVDETLPTGVYYVVVQSRQGTGSYQLAVDQNATIAAPPTPVRRAVSESKHAIIIADFDGSGVPDLAVANSSAGTISILAGQGDGTFLTKSTIVVGGHPSALVTADFNKDGRNDLAVTDALTGEVDILLGVGDGTFQAPARYQVGSSPAAIVAGDFNCDGNLDIAVADSTSNDVAFLYGSGHGTFQAGPRIQVGQGPITLVAADLNGDHRTDLVTANSDSGDLTFLWNLGQGNFQTSTWHSVSMTPTDLIAADFGGTGLTDLAIADTANNRVLILWALGGGNFSAPSSLDVGDSPEALVATDLDAAGENDSDLIVCNHGSQDLTIFVGFKNGQPTNVYNKPLSETPAGIVAGPLHGEFVPDLAVVNASSGQVDVFLGGGDGVFASPESTVPLPHPAPYASPDGYIITIDTNGQLLLRLPRDGSPGEFEPPVSETADGTGNTARDVAALSTALGPVYGVLDRRRPLLIMARPLPSGAIDLSYIPLPAGGIYTRVIGADLNRDGLDDMLVLDRGGNKVLEFQQDAAGQFHLSNTTISVGFGPTDLTVADLNHDGWEDLIVANGSSGDISVIPGGPGGTFGTEVRLRAGLSPAGTLKLPDGLTRSSADTPVGVTTGVFDASGLTDVVVVDRGTDSISILKGTPGGGLADPSTSTTYTTGSEPIQVVAANLRGPGLLDLVVLNEGSQDISIFLNNGHGGFITCPRVDAGNDPTGVAVHDVNADGIPDLLVGNASGDLLVLLGNGDGTFRPYNRVDQTLNLAVGDLNGDGKVDFVYTNGASDQLTVQDNGNGSSFLQDRGNGLLAPGPVAISDLNGDGIPDLVLTNRGGNDVIVYLGLGGGRFGEPRRYFTGTSPVGLTISDLNGDGIPDLVVTNEGSNDVSILLGENMGNAWTLTKGPRLRVGLRPIATTVADVDGDGIKDIICVNQDSDSLTLLRGLGGGFFDDQNARTFATGTAPIQAFFGPFGPDKTSGILSLDSVSSTLTYYANPLVAGDMPVTLSTGGQSPVAGVMTYFNKDGFADLIVANGGDNTLALFLGGTNGLTLTKTIALNNSNRLTALALVSGVGGDQLFIGTEGQGQSLSLLLRTSDFGQSPSSFEVTLVVSGAASPPPIVGISVSDQLSVLESHFDTSSTNLIAPSRGPAQANAISSTSSAIAGIGAIVAQAIRPYVGALSSLVGMVDLLAQMKQAQTSEVVPLGETDVALIAVILSVTRSNDHEAGDGAHDDRWEGRSFIDEALADYPPLSEPSALDRALANADALLASIPQSRGEAAQRAMLDPEWVWRLQSSGAPQMVMVDVEDSATLASLSRESDSTSETSSDSNTTSEVALVSESDSSAEASSPETSIEYVETADLRSIGIGSTTAVFAAMAIWRVLKDTFQRRTIKLVNKFKRR